MRRSSAGLLSGVSRLLASVTLLGVLVVLPLVVWRGVGGKSGGIDWRGSLGSGRIDADTVVALGLIVFSALWVWFALTAVGEIARVVAWHRHPTATLPPVPPSPSGAIRRLVRAALVSTSAVMGAGLVSLTGVSGARAAAMNPVAAVSPSAMTAASPASFIDGHGGGAWTPGTVRSSGRDTPYSVAVRLGDPQLRDQIIALNHGATGPDGSSWTGGVFPAGMVVEVPEGVGGPRPTTWVPYAVEEGDSVYRIAAHLANGDNSRVRDLADAIIDRNLGRVMLDGRVFDDPSLIRIGWLLDVPAASEPGPSDQGAPTTTWDRTHVVRPGESYWSIAEQHIDPPADAGDVAHLARDLQAHNAPLLGYGHAAMLHPGDPVELPEPSPDVAPAMAPLPIAAPANDESVGDPSADNTSADDMSADMTTAPAGVAANEPDLPGDTEPARTPPVLELPPQPIAAVERDMLPPVSTSPTDRPSVEVATQVAPDADADADADAGADTEARSPVTTSLAAAVLLCAGALGLVESRRRQQLRRAGTNSRAPQPTPREVEIERLVRSLDAAQRAVRLDLALRVAGHLLVGTGGFVLGAIVAHDGGVTLLLDRPGRSPSGPWSLGAAADRWELSARTPNEELAPLSRLAGQPCPALVHLGRVAVDTCEPSSGGGELFLDLEAFGLVCIDADTDGSHRGADAILRAIAASLAASPVGETLRLITHDLDPAVHLGNDNAECARDFDEAIDMAASALGSTPTAIGHRRTSELRARGIGGEAWEPVVVVSAADDHEPAALRELLDVTRGGGRGLAVVLRHAVDGASLTVRATTQGWQMERLGLTVVPVGLDEKHVIDLHDLLSAAAQPVEDVALTARHATVLASRNLAHPDPLADPSTEPAWALLVRVLGGVDVVDRDGAAVAFERGKSLELVAWLSEHRDQATRGGARAALWDLDVRDATFANVVSDARRSLGRAVAPAEGDEWIARTLTDQLPLHPRVVTDADLLRCRLDHSRRLGHPEAIETLRPGVAMIRDLPFSGTDFLWPDAEGITSSLTLLATSAATELARHHLSLGDIEGVFWATGHGLRALPGHEELIGLRMRAHAHCGDLAGVRQEWEGYERAITADPWSDGEPSPKLLSLRRQLLSA